MPKGVYARPADFRAALAERMRKMNADPEFAARNAAAAAERMRRLRADPAFAARQSAAASEHMRRVLARRCEFCGAAPSERYPLTVTVDKHGERYTSCRDLDRCDRRFVGIPA